MGRGTKGAGKEARIKAAGTAAPRSGSATLVASGVEAVQRPEADANPLAEDVNGAEEAWPASPLNKQTTNLKDLPMDESEYADEVDNEFVRGRMENVARVATADDVRITFGSGFHTDMNGTIQLDPYDPGPDAPPEDRIIMMQGGLEHEVCHELYYDKAAFEELQNQVRQDSDRAPVAYLNNILADGHDEWRHKLSRPEAYEIIAAHDTLFCDHNGSGRWSFDPDNQDTWTQVTGAMLYRALPYYQVPEDKLSDEARDIYHEVAPRVDAAVAGTSWDCLREANEIHDVLKNRGVIPQDPPTDHLQGGAGPGASGAPGMGSGSPGGAEDRPLTDDERQKAAASNPSDGDSPESGSAGDGNGSQGDDEQSQNAAESGTGGGTSESGSDAGSGPKGQKGSDSPSAGADSGDDTTESEDPGTGDTGSQDPADKNPFVADQDAGQEALENRRGQAKTLANTARNRRPQSGDRDDPTEGVRRDQEALSEFRSRWTKNRRVAQEFAGAIEEARTETLAAKTRQESGRLDRRRRRALSTGDDKVFIKRGRARKTDMSVEFLLDVSGSMSTKIPGLKDSAAVVSQGLDLADIPHEVRGFGSPGQMPLYRSFEEKPDWKLGAMRTMGTTALDEGMEKVRGGFAGRTEKQKLALVLTDGIPDKEDPARQQIAAARRDGVTVMGVFLRENLDGPDYAGLSQEDRDRYKERHRQMEDECRQLFGGRVAVIDDVRQLPRVAGKKIVDLLRREQ